MTFQNHLWIGVFSASFVQQQADHVGREGLPSSLQMDQFCGRAHDLADEALCAYRRMKVAQQDHARGGRR